MRPLATEPGFWRPVEDGREVELLLAHPTGILELYYGTMEPAKIQLKTDSVVRSPLAKEYNAGVPALRARRVPAVLGHGHGGDGPGAAEPRLRAAEAGGLRRAVSDLGAALRARGMRLTPQRRRIVDALTSLEHGTPDAVAAKVAEDGGAPLPLSTIYRGLDALEELGDRLAHASGPPGADLPPRRPRHPHPPGLPGLRDRLRGSDRDGRRVRRECPGRHGL